ncbi:OTU-like cysteine [Favolaschia claudopus]|uniref:Ubiquitin thioesterase OTU n=1 Tax=Favolaschia claudopus TaxID=2862362 RepID=A0AAW0B5C8_9AGAR
MAPVRLRHPKGVSTIQVAFDKDDFTVQDLQQEIYAVTEILPSRQALKSGYPPRTLTIVPELPLSSLGLSSGEQIIVSELADASGAARPAKPSQAASSSPFLNPISTPQSNSSQSPPAAAPTSSRSTQSAASVAPASTSSGPAAVETDGSFLVHRVVPDDNACLFSSVALIFEQDMKKAQKMREIVADGIRKDPETYNEAILGMAPDKYITKILSPSTWGGAIELAILASTFQTEICSVDVETGRIDQFTPKGLDLPENRCLVIYSGIHYDAATLAPMADAPSEWHQTVFPTRSASVLEAAKKLADVLREKRAFTNTATFSVKCEQCGKVFKGEKGAQAHATETGHTRFGES